MRKFNITVNGVAYEVEVEEVAAGESAAPAAAPKAAAPAPKAAPAAKPAAPKAAPVANGTKVNAPMPGTILDVKVAQGQAVKKGDILCILEAMKMENEILAPQDGTVAQVNVTKGASVNSGDPLVVLN
ncbi:MAG: acetyl-CoA carboxylase biotin carboxyl carrier protein subunit [Clostridia bacterium]|nr:acetyl-CoA carboxylase biotin carboxyl carrier protein subunit [Clostridia bacterium]MBR0407161.1 acetyl-CoA carboxylase biotin carboxyl carrier protein subunit [Clostridia bacterium]